MLSSFFKLFKKTKTDEKVQVAAKVQLDEKVQVNEIEEDWVDDMHYTLVVIDMQEQFTAYLKAKAGTVSAINQAMQDKAGIVLVEFTGFGPTIKELTKLVDGYARVTTVQKNSPGGGMQVMRAIKDNKFPASVLKICGVNTDQCVLSTVTDLVRLSPKSRMHVIEKACNTDGYHENGINSMKKHAQVTIV